VLTVNQEEQKVTVEGRVRPQDVSADNVVLSPRIADARITFLGEGALSSRQRRPWWRYLLEFLGF
jgi:flagellar L-ring protein precursor FlgH